MPRLLLAAALVVALAGCAGAGGGERPSAGDPGLGEASEPASARPAASPPGPGANPAAATTTAPATPARPPATPAPVDAPVLEAGRADAAVLPGEPALLALGDSLAAGTGLARPRDGFVWRVHRALADAHGTGYGLVNLAVPGATSEGVLRGEQLAEAERVLAARRVDTVLLSVGGNDLLALFAGPCGEGLDSPACAAAVDTAVAAYAERLDATLARLRAAAPDAAVVLLQVYNPFDLDMGSRPEVVATEATSALNAAAAQVAERHGVRTADGYAALEGRITATTGMGAAQPDVHPTVLGHDVLARAILEALRR